MFPFQIFFHYIPSYALHLIMITLTTFKLSKKLLMSIRMNFDRVETNLFEGNTDSYGRSFFTLHVFGSRVRNALIGLQPGFNNFYTRYYGQKPRGSFEQKGNFPIRVKSVFPWENRASDFRNQQVFKITRHFSHCFGNIMRAI